MVLNRQNTVCKAVVRYIHGVYNCYLGKKTESTNTQSSFLIFSSIKTDADIQQ